MKRYVDLSGLVENGLWSYRVLPGLEGLIPPASIETIATVKQNDFFASRISLSSIPTQNGKLIRIAFTQKAATVPLPDER